MTYILAGDIGGTNCRLALASINKTKATLLFQNTLPSSRYASFTALLEEFIGQLQDHGFAKPEWAAFGVAGPVAKERAKLTNLPWIIDAAMLQQQFSFAKVRVLNDFEALAYAYPALGPEDLALIKEGAENKDDPIGFLGAGTGLGAAVYFPRWHFVQPTESGHLDFAPCDEKQEKLLRHLRAIYGHVSYERIVSGPGLAMLYQFLAKEQNLTVQPLSPPEVTDLALAGDHLAESALELFVRIYGQKTGNMALAHLCQGGILLAGGIAPKIIDWLKSPLFVTAFLDKGRMKPILETIPIHVITDTDAGLKGAMFALFERHAWSD